MGCYNMACGISGYHIGNEDDCYMAILFPTPYEDINRGPLSEYSFLSLPILGKYNDYGDIKDVVRDKNVEALEKFFGISIEGITDCASDFRKRGGIEYTDFGSLQKWYGVKNIELYINRKTLEKFGFVFEGDNFTHPEFKLPEGHSLTLVVNKNEYATRVIYFDGKKRELDRYETLFEILNRIKFADWCGYSFQKRPEYIFGVSKEMQPKAMLLHRARVVFFKKEIFDGYLKIHIDAIAKDESYQKYYKKYDDEAREKFLSLYKNNLFTDKSQEMRSTILELRRAIMEHGLGGGFSNFYDIYGENGLDFIDDLMKMRYFSQMLYKLNRVIRPTLSLEQQGSKKEQLPFIQFHVELLKKEIEAEESY